MQPRLGADGEQQGKDEQADGEPDRVVSQERCRNDSLASAAVTSSVGTHWRDWPMNVRKRTPICSTTRANSGTVQSEERR